MAQRLIFFCVFALWACGGEVSSTDSGSADGGSALDADPASDSGPRNDGSPNSDAEPPADGGGEDSSPTPDAGSAPVGTSWDYLGNPFTSVQGVGNIRYKDGENSTYFVAPRSGQLARFYPHYAFTHSAWNNLGRSGNDSPNPQGGYSLGTGGRYRITIFEDVDGAPDTTRPVGEPLVWQVPDMERGIWVGGSRPQTLGFAPHELSGVSLVAGRKYHLHYENIDPNPMDNWLSMDAGWSTADTGERKGHVPPVADWGQLKKDGRTDYVWADWVNWTPAGRLDPSIIFEYADGFTFGDPTVAAGSALSGEVAQMFTPDQTVTVDSLSAFAEGEGSLEARLTGGGTDIIVTLAGYSDGWSTQKTDFAATVLEADTQYTLTFRGPPSLAHTHNGANNDYRPRFSGWGDRESGNSAMVGGTPVNSGYNDLAGVAFRTVP